MMTHASDGFVRHDVEGAGLAEHISHFIGLGAQAGGDDFDEWIEIRIEPDDEREDLTSRESAIREGFILIDIGICYGERLSPRTWGGVKGKRKLTSEGA